MKTIEIQVPEAPEGYEIVDCRPGEEGDLFLRSDCLAGEYHLDTKQVWPVYILKKKRWRAKNNSSYFYVCITNGLASAFAFEAVEMLDPVDDALWSVGNYYKTLEEAQAVADRINAIFKENT